jgi:hypothetical protein
MRNDARPIGPEADDQSPLSEQHSRDVVNGEAREDCLNAVQPRNQTEHKTGNHEGTKVTKKSTKKN